MQIPYSFKVIEYDESVAHRLIEIAAHSKASLIVIGTQKRVGGVKRTILQTESEHVNHHSHIPVLIVHK